jgi:HSP20 family protein
MTLGPYSSRQRRNPGQRVITPGHLDPYREMEDINTRFGQLIQSFFQDSPGMPSAGAWSMLPAVDIEETDDAYIVDVDMPNVNPDDVMLDLRGEELHIAGRTHQRDRAGVMRRQHRPAGAFEWVVDLPNDIDPNRVEATYDSGVLTISVGKTRDAQPRRIAIQVTHASGNGRNRPDQ